MKRVWHFLKHFLIVVSVLGILSFVYWGGYGDGIWFAIDYIYDNDMQPEDTSSWPWEDKNITLVRE